MLMYIVDYMSSGVLHFYLTLSMEFTLGEESEIIVHHYMHTFLCSKSVSMGFVSVYMYYK